MIDLGPCPKCERHVVVFRPGEAAPEVRCSCEVGCGVIRDFFYPDQWTIEKLKRTTSEKADEYSYAIREFYRAFAEVNILGPALRGLGRFAVHRIDDVRNVTLKALDLANRIDHWSAPSCYERLLEEDPLDPP